MTSATCAVDTEIIQMCGKEYTLEPVRSLSRDKLYYLSHPLTTYGDIEFNKSDALECERLLVNQYDICVLNVVTLELAGNQQVSAMEKCKHLFRACDEIIFSGVWEKSHGCMDEFRWMKDSDMQGYILIGTTLYKLIPKEVTE